ncbi:hypothetical protein DUI87_04266 [Hirundo rustica rustica]|uniref:Uncharacterized protein n=1 Tax=Hirundo rustica rustica TaxID=333673 RepID=A0A3M0L5W5_HIRRU|nr:hypothetical protein DUI87_04266 [Hirundo rustica rustica]
MGKAHGNCRNWMRHAYFQGGFGMQLPAQSWLINVTKHIIEPGFQPGVVEVGLEGKDQPLTAPLPRRSFTLLGRYEHTTHQAIVISLLNLQVEQPWNKPVVK